MSALKTLNPESEIQEILNRSTEKFNDLSQDIRDLLTSEAAFVIEARHRIGVLINDLLDTQDNSSPTCISDLARIHNRDRNFFSTCRVFAERYNEAQMRELVSARTPLDQPLTWSHVAVLIRVTVDEQRKALQDRAIACSMTCEELENALVKERPPSSSGGRPHKVPTTFEGCVDNITSVVSQLVSRAEQVWLSQETGLPTMAKKVDFSQVTPQQRQAIAVMESALRTAQLQMAALSREVAYVVQKVNAASSRKKLTDPIHEEEED